MTSLHYQNVINNLGELLEKIREERKTVEQTFHYLKARQEALEKAIKRLSSCEEEE